MKVLVRRRSHRVLSKGSGYQNYNNWQAGMTEKVLEKAGREQS